MATVDGGEKVRLSFERLHYTVNVKGSGLPKALLQNINGDVTSGHVLAILGPSGAGKTTLLNALTLQQAGGSPSGYIRVNGEPLTTDMYDRVCAYVEQFDTLWASLTAREHLEYAMALHRGDLDVTQRAAEVDKLLHSVGLEEFQHTRAGSEIIRGLSSGNKRRLSVALALVKRPKILFLDEPTSGVDSASAVRMMTFLKNVAREQNIAVACTIHQPPASVFAGFDNVMVLSMGRVAYFGKAAKMAAYLTGINNAPTADTNPAEFILDLVNKDFTSTASVKAVLDKWSEGTGEAYGCDMEKGDGKPLALADFQRAPFAKQLTVLTDRSVVVARREPLAYLVRLVANFNATLFFGIIYIETRDKVQAQINPRTFFLMFCVGIPMQFILVSNFIYHYQWLSLKKEVKDGMYHPAANAIASWIVQIPMMFILALSSLIPMFALGDLNWDSFGIVLVLYAVTFWAFEGLAQAFSTFPNVIYGLFMFLNIYFMAFLFCGMFVDPEDVVWPIRMFCYFLPLGWTLQSYMYGLWHHIGNHKGVTYCTPGDALPQGGVCTAQGFYCYSEEDPSGAVCYGETGDQILESLSVQFTIFEAKGHYARNIGFIIAFGSLCRIGYITAVYVLTKMYGGQTPAEPSESYEVTVDAEDEDDKNSLAVSVADAPPAPISKDDPDGTTFCFKDISYSIPGKKGEGDKRVLTDVSATVHAGEVLAIVGPSGAGKTILLDTLTYSKGPGAPAGDITLDGHKMSRSVFVEQAIYVPREDNLWPTMNPRQHLEFAFKNFRPELDADSLKAEVDELLSVTGLTSCQDTRAGGFLFKGLSGGQRRRLSLAVALVKRPRVIILDEPTSGLDSAAAAAIVTLLDNIAQKCKAAVICTIHQPSALVFAGFHKVLVLSEGRVAFCGERNAMAPYFASVGSELSHDANPAEAVLDLVSKDATSEEAVKAILDKWEDSKDSKSLALMSSGVEGKAPPSRRGAAAGAVASTFHVFKRQVALSLVDPLQYIGRMAAVPPIVAFFGLVYLASRETNQKQVPFRLFYLWWVLALPACMSISTLIGSNMDNRSVVYEIRAGMYKAWSYAMSTTLVQIPALFILAVGINIAAFAVGGWPWDNFLTFSVTITCTLMVFDNLAQLLAVAFVNPVIGMLAFLGFWSSSIVFCGLVFRGEDVVWPFRLFYYVMPLKWTFGSAGYDLFMPSDFSGAEICVPGAEIRYADDTVSTCSPVGYYCDGMTSSFGCWGRTGTQVLDTLKMSYESLSSTDYRGRDLGVLLAMTAALKLGYIFILMKKVSATDSPQKPAKVAPRK